MNVILRTREQEDRARGLRIVDKKLLHEAGLRIGAAVANWRSGMFGRADLLSADGWSSGRARGVIMRKRGPRHAEAVAGA